MEDLKEIFAENLSALRKKKGWTQLELAEKLNYSDKAVSKWERGESLPDVVILKRIAELHEVSVDFLLTREHEQAVVPLSKRKKRNRAMITGISAATVWLIGCILFFSLGFVETASPGAWLIFLAAIPATCVVLLVFSALWWGKKLLLTTVSILVWSLLLFSFFTVLFVAEKVIWPIFIIGIPAQVIIGLWAGMRRE